MIKHIPYHPRRLFFCSRYRDGRNNPEPLDIHRWNDIAVRSAADQMRRKIDTFYGMQRDFVSQMEAISELLNSVDAR